MRYLKSASHIACLLLSLAVRPAPAATIATFQIAEQTGVSYPDQICEVDVKAAYNPKTSKLLGPNGNEVPYQPLYGRIAFPCRLPASTVSTYYSSAGPFDTTADTVTMNSGIYSFQPNTLVSVTTTASSCGWVNGATYFVLSKNTFTGGIALSTTLGGSRADITSTCNDPSLTYTGFIADGSTDTFTAPNHQRRAGDPIKFVGSGGACPSGITCDGVTVYFVIASGLTANSFKVSTSVGGSAVDIGNVTAGLNKLVTDWSWTLVDTGAPTATHPCPNVVDRSASGYDQVTNCQTGYRTLKLASLQSWSVGAGTLTSIVDSGSKFVITFPGPHGLSASQVITINGDSSVVRTNGPTGVHTIESVTATTATINKAISPGIYNAGTLTVFNTDMSLNPLQGLRLSDGTWVGTGKSLYQSAVSGDATGGNIGGWQSNVSKAAMNQSYTCKFTAAGALKTSIQCTYTTYRPQYNNGAGVLQGATVGVGTYPITFTLYAGSKSVIVTQGPSDMNYGMYQELYSQWPGNKPNRRVLRTGNSASYNNTDCGYYQGGTITGVTNANPTVITTSADNGMITAGTWHMTITGVGGNTGANVSNVVITPIDANHFSIPVDTSAGGAYTSGGTVTGYSTNYNSKDHNVEQVIDYSRNITVGGCTTTENPALSVWNFQDTGGNLQYLYNSSDTSDKPIIGIYAGGASVAVNAGVNVLGVYSSNSHPVFGGAALGFFELNEPCYRFAQQVPENPYPCSQTDAPFPVYATANVREWGYYMGTKADITSTNGNTPAQMSIEQNTYAGINLTRLFTYQTVFSDPVGGWKNPWMDDTALSTIRTNYQTNNPAGYTAKVNQSAGGASDPILQILGGTTSAAIDSAVLNYPGNIQDFMYALVYGDGVYDSYYAYVQSTYFSNPLSVAIATALAHPSITASQKAQFKAWAAILGSIIWDGRFVPPDVAGEGGGTLNQSLQVAATKDRFVTTFPSQPFLAQFVPTVTTNTINNLASATYTPGGSSTSNPHYNTASHINTFWVMLAQKKLLGLDLGATYPRVSPFCRDWTPNILTPPDPRFGNLRKFPSWGDGNTEALGIVGLCATMMAGVDTGISQKSIAVWFAQASSTLFPYDTFGGNTVISVDTTITPGTLGLGTINLPLYYTSLRHNYGTANEHWIGILNGDGCIDHCHADKGSFVGYFNRVPLFVDPSSNIYAPNLGGAINHSNVIRDSNMPVAAHWYDSPNSVDLPGKFGASAQSETLAFTKVSLSTQTFTAGDGTVWTRKMALANGNAAYPILGVWDRFTGTSASASKTNQFWMLHNGGAVATPAGNVSPTMNSTGCAAIGAPPDQFPSAGTPAALSSGLQHFALTGSNWPALGNGINTDIYLVRGTSGANTALSGWGSSCGDGSGEYAAANTVNITGFSVSSSTVAVLTLAGHNVQVGDTATISGVNGAGSPNQATVTATAVTSTAVTFSGFSGLTGSYSGGTMSPYYREHYVRLLVNDTGAFTTYVMPYLKNASPTRTVTSPSGTALRSVQGAETTNVSEAQMDFTDGTVNVLTAFDTASHSAFSMTVSGGPQEVVANQSTISWKVEGQTAGLRNFTPPPGSWYPDKPVMINGNTFSVYHPGGEQPSAYAITFTQTPVTLGAVAVSFLPASTIGATQVRFKYGSSIEYLSLSACNSTCTVSILIPQGTTTISWDYMDANGTVLASSSLAAVTTIN